MEYEDLPNPQLNSGKFIAMQIELAAKVSVSLQLQAEIIAFQQGKDYNTVYESINESVRKVKLDMTSNLFH